MYNKCSFTQNIKRKAMLDKRCLFLLNLINGECVSSGYKIFSFSELALSFPAHLGIDDEGVKECIKVLSEREYVSVKYEDDKEVCVCPLTKGRLIFERKIEEQTEKQRAEKRYFFYSFIGGVTGSAIITAITLILLLIFRRV